MSQPRRTVGVPVLLGLVAYALAFAQRPGLATADTKINLHVDPGRFLSDVASMWTSTGQLGGVQTGQQAGYLFPMGPFFALGHLIGLPDWVVQRLWLGSLLALAAWGAVRLLDAMLSEPRGVAHLVTGLVILLNPFVVTYANRTTVTLLAYAALPWLLLAVHRGLREPGGWRWPAAAALLVTAAGGGINGAVVAWMLLGPALLLVYEVVFTRVGGPDARAFLVRAIPLAVLLSLWWVIPAYVQSSYGVNFLQFTEQPGTVWGTTSSTEALRLQSFWLSYVGIGFQGRAIPYFDDSLTLLFSAPVVVATLLLPAAALGGFGGIRRWRYAPFFLGLALVAVLVMMAGFPDGTPLRHGLFFTYDHVAAVRFLRASYKGAPLLAVALSVLAGVAAGALWARLGVAWARLGLLWRPALAVAGAAVLVGAAWPLVIGHAQDAQVSYHRIPAAWQQAASDLDRELPANSRAIVLPGDLFSFYQWGGTVDPILPALSSRPVAERSEVPYTDLRATDLEWTIDGLVHQQRLVPGQLGPLLSLIGVRSVVSGADDDLARSDAPAPADAAAALQTQPGFQRPARTYGPTTRYASATQPGAAERLPQVRRYDLPRARGLVRVEPVRDPLVVDGSADGLAGLAAFGMLPAQRAVLYAGDLGPAALRREVASGGDVVITDSNRRQAFAASTLEQNTGAVLTADETVSADGFILDPFGRGPDDETVAVYGGGARAVQAPFSPQRVQFPEHGPFAAIDGSTQTAWLADPTLDPSQRWLEVDFSLARRVSSVDLVPYDDAGGSVRAVSIAGHSFAVHPGLNHLSLPGGTAVSSLRVAITAVSPPQAGAKAGAGGIRELRIPGVHPTQALRLPVDAAAALAGADLRHDGLTYLFSRVTGDDPYERNPARGPWSALDVSDAGDAEQTMSRDFQVPGRRRFAATAWVAPFATAPDPALDRLAGYRGPVVATSSDRADGEPRWRASQALDGDPRTAWLGSIAGGQTPWLAWQTPRPTTVRTLRLGAPSAPVARPTQVRLTWPGGATPALPVDGSGRVALPRAVSARRFRLTVLTAAVTGPAHPSAADRGAVGIAELRGVRGLPVIRAGRFRGAPCGAVRIRVGGAVMRLRATGSAASFAQGRPLLARACGAPVTLAHGPQHLQVLGGTFAVNDLRLQSPPPAPVATAAAISGRVLAAGTSGHGSYSGVRISVRGPAWLVLGEGYDRGWSATCNGRSLGAPTPIDGYANGWRIGPGCTSVAFTFSPNRLATIGYVASGAAALVCVLLLVIGGWRRRGVVPDPPTVQLAPGRAAPPSSPSVVWALPAALVFGFVFGVDAGIVAAAAIAIVLWRRIGAGPLTVVAGALLGVVVPVLYLVHPGSSAGGNHYGYAAGHLAAHWVGVAAIGLLMAALWRTLRSQ